MIVRSIRDVNSFTISAVTLFRNDVFVSWGLLDSLTS